MAYAPSRSMNGDLNEGATDGKYKKFVQDRGGAIDPATVQSRKDLEGTWFGVTEKQPKVRGDGKIVSTPNYVSN